MSKGIPKNGINKGWFQKGHIPKNGFQKGHLKYGNGGFKKGHIGWGKGKKRPEITGENHPRWKGGRKDDGKGYIFIKSYNHPNRNRQNYVYEHRIVMEKKIGRYLERWEVVHHINGIRDDNRPENLELCPDNITNTAIDNLLRENKRLKTKIKELEIQLKK